MSSNKRNWKNDSGGFYRSAKVGPFIIDVAEVGDGYVWGILCSNGSAWHILTEGQANSIAEGQIEAKAAIRRMIESANADLDALDSRD